MQSRHIPGFLNEIESFYKQSLKLEKSVDTAKINRLFNKYQHFEYKKLPRVIKHVSSPIELIYFILFYKHLNGCIFQVAGMFVDGAKKPIYSCNKVDDNLKNIIPIQTIIETPTFPIYIESESISDE